MAKPENYFLNCHSEESITIRYKKLAKKMHPDKNNGTTEATALFQEMKIQRDQALKSVYKKTGASDDAIEIKLRDFITDLDKMDFKNLNGTAQSLAEKFVEDNPDKEVNFGNMFSFVMGELFGAEKKKNLKGKPDEQKKLK